MPPTWDQPYETVRRRLLAQPGVAAALMEAFENDPQTAGQFAGLRYTPPPEYTSHVFLFATWVPTGTPVMVKLLADPNEQYWMTAIGKQSPGLTPRVFASGEHIGAYPVRWMVLEQIPYALSHDWGDRMYDLLAQAAVDFQTAARAIDQRYVSLVSYQATCATLQRGLREGCPGPVQHILDRLARDWIWVNEQCGLEVCFGDLTMGNACAPTPPAGVPSPGRERIMLIDPIPRIAPWAWDAAYCQTLDANKDVRMIQSMAEARRARGLPVPEPPVVDRLAAILLAWLGAHRWWNTAFRREDPDWCDQIQQYIETAATLKAS